MKRFMKWRGQRLDLTFVLVLALTLIAGDPVPSHGDLPPEGGASDIAGVDEGSADSGSLSSGGGFRSAPLAVSPRPSERRRGKSQHIQVEILSAEEIKTLQAQGYRRADRNGIVRRSKFDPVLARAENQEASLNHHRRHRRRGARLGTYVCGKTVKASCYGRCPSGKTDIYNDQPTRSGEIYHYWQHTIACNGCGKLKKWVRLRNLDTGDETLAWVNDTGGFEKYGRGIDVSLAIAQSLGMNDIGKRISVQCDRDIAGLPPPIPLPPPSSERPGYSEHKPNPALPAPRPQPASENDKAAPRSRDPAYRPNPNTPAGSTNSLGIYDI